MPCLVIGELCGNAGSTFDAAREVACKVFARFLSVEDFRPRLWLRLRLESEEVEECDEVYDRLFDPEELLEPEEYDLREGGDLLR